MTSIATIRCNHGSESLHKELNRQRKSNLFCDVTIVVDKEKFSAHQCVLAASSEYFEELFDEQHTPMSEDIHVPLENVTASSLRDVLSFMYGEDLCVSLDSVAEILQTATALSVPNLLSELHNYLVSILDLSNCWRLFSLAQDVPLLRLLDVIQNFFLKNFVKINASDQFLKLSADVFEVLLSSDNLEVEEETAVYETLLNWTNWDIASRKKLFPILFRYVRLHLISPLYLAETVRLEMLVKEFPDCVELVQESFHFHINPASFTKQNQRRSPKLDNGNTLLVTPYRLLRIASKEVLSVSQVQHNCAPVETCSVAICNGTKATFCGGLRGDVVCGDVVCGDVTQVHFDEENAAIWTSLPRLMKSRCGTAAVYFQDSLYTFGGQTSFQLSAECFLEDVEMLDKEINNWIVISKMSSKRSYCKAVVLGSEIYVMGGYTESFQLRSNCELTKFPPPPRETSMVEFYNPASNVWKRGPDMNTARTKFSAEVVKDQIFVLGGKKFSNIESLRAGANTWTKIVSQPPIVVSHVSTGILGSTIIATGEWNNKLWSSEVPHDCNLRWKKFSSAGTAWIPEKTKPNPVKSAASSSLLTSPSARAQSSAASFTGKKVTVQRHKVAPSKSNFASEALTTKFKLNTPGNRLSAPFTFSSTPSKQPDIINMDTK